MVEQQRRDEVALVERLEHVDRVDDAGRVRMRQLLHERFDRRQIAAAQPHFGGHDVAPLDALAERPEVALARAERHEDPHDRHREAGVAEPLPVELQAPRLDEHEQQQRADRLRARDRP